MRWEKRRGACGAADAASLGLCGGRGLTRCGALRRCMEIGEESGLASCGGCGRAEGGGGGRNTAKGWATGYMDKRKVLYLQPAHLTYRQPGNSPGLERGRCFDKLLGIDLKLVNVPTNEHL